MSSTDRTKYALSPTSTVSLQEDSQASSKGARGAVQPHQRGSLRRGRADRGRPWRSALARKPQALRRIILRHPWMSPVSANILATVQVQRYFRGYLARKRFLSGSRDKGDGSDERRNLCSHARRRRSRSRVSLQLDKYLQSLRRGGNGEGNMGNDAGRRKSSGTGGYSEWCSTRIQAWWRMVLVRRKYYLVRYRVYCLAAVQIQYAWKAFQQDKIFKMSIGEIAETRTEPVGHHDPSPPKKRLLGSHSTAQRTLAAAVIQSNWRKRVCQSIYKYYRDMINFRLSGDPKMLLRTINPSETHLFDKAAGVHVRFRLGGASFPPNIYYKESNSLGGPLATPGKIKVGASYFGTTVHCTGPNGTKNWYQRIENNGWRPVGANILSDKEDKDSITVEGDAQSMPFHYSRIQRERDLALRRKQQRRRWLMAMHREGLAKGAAGTASKDFPGEALGGSGLVPPTTGGQAHPKGMPVLRVRTAEQREKGHMKQDKGSSYSDPGMMGSLCTEDMAIGPHAARIATGHALGTLSGGKNHEEPWQSEEKEALGLLRWSQELNFDSYICNWRQMATSGPSEPWRNADDLAAIQTAVAKDLADLPANRPLHLNQVLARGNDHGLSHHNNNSSTEINLTDTHHSNSLL